MNTRRTVIRSAAWAVPAVTLTVAAPAFATSHNPNPSFRGAQREGANFRVKVTAPEGKTITAVYIAGEVAKYSNPQEEWTAKLQRESDSTQMVTVTYTDGTQSVVAVYFHE